MEADLTIKKDSRGDMILKRTWDADQKTLSITFLNLMRSFDEMEIKIPLSASEMDADHLEIDILNDEKSSAEWTKATY